MISLILPYWDRQGATDEALRHMVTHYHDLDLEIILVNDGSQFVKPCWPLNIKVVELPQKDKPLNPCVPYNRGVEASTGEYIALSNPETIHRTPILEQMRGSIQEPEDYIMAAAWCPEQNRWHSHSTRALNKETRNYVPKGSGYHFMTLMQRSLWDKSGGFDEDYRLGAGYDDPDFVRRLHRVGTRFLWRDDLVVDHIRTDARAAWTGTMFERNLQLFMSKWKPL